MSLLKWPVGVALASLSFLAFAAPQGGPPPPPRFVEDRGCDYHDNPLDPEFDLCENDNSGYCLGTCTRIVGLPGGYVQIWCKCVTNTPG